MQPFTALVTVLALSAALSVTGLDGAVLDDGSLFDAQFAKDCVLTGAFSSCDNSSAWQLLQECTASDVNDSNYTVHFLLGSMPGTADLLRDALPIPSGEPGVAWYVQNRTDWTNSLMDIARGRQTVYDAMVLDPALIPETVASGALMDFGPFLATDRWQEEWQDIVSTLRWQVSTTDVGSVHWLPLSAADMVLHYRADVLAAHGLAVPRTWEQLVQAVRATHGRPAGPAAEADTEFYGFCTMPFQSCHSPTYELLAVWASFIQTQGLKQGAFFDPATLTPLVQNAAMAAALLYYRTLASYRPPISLNASIVCNSLYGVAHMLYESGMCAFQLAPQSNFKRNALLAPSAAVREYSKMAYLPGATLVMDRATGGLVPCTYETCPYAKAMPRWPGDAKVQAEVLYGGSSTIGTISPPTGNTTSSNTSEVDDSDTNSGAGSSSGGGGSGVVLANLAPVMCLSPLGLAINSFTSPRQQAYSIRWLRRMTAPDTMWRLMVSPQTPLAPIQYKHFLPSNRHIWLAEGYDPDGLDDYLRLSHDMLTHGNRLRYPLALQRFVQYRTALNNAAFAAVGTNRSVDSIMSELATQLAVPFGPTSPAYGTLRLQYLVSIGNTELLNAPAPPPPPPPPTRRYYVGREDRPSDTSKTNGALAAAAAVSTVGIVGLLTLLVFLYKQLMVDRGWGRSKDPGVGPQTTLVVTDIEGSTCLWEDVDARVMDIALNLHHDTVRRVIAHFGGYESVTEGDSFTVAFHTAEAAVSFSLVVQSELMEQPWPEEVLRYDACRPVYVLSTKRLRHLTARAASRAAATAFTAIDGLDPPELAVVGALNSGPASTGAKPSLRTFSKIGRRLELLSGQVRRSASFVGGRPPSGLAVPGRGIGGAVSSLLSVALAGARSGGSGTGNSLGGGGGRTGSGTGDSVLLDVAGAQCDSGVASSRHLLEHFLPYSGAAPAVPPPVAVKGLRNIGSPGGPFIVNSGSPSLSLGRLPAGSLTFADGSGGAAALVASTAASAPPAWQGVTSSVAGRQQRNQLYHGDSIDPTDTPGSSGAEQDAAGGGGSAGVTTVGPSVSQLTGARLSNSVIGNQSSPQALPAPLSRPTSGLRSLPCNAIPSVPEEPSAPLMVVRRTRSTVVITEMAAEAAASPGTSAAAVAARCTASGSGMASGRALSRVLTEEAVSKVRRRPSRLADAPVPPTPPTPPMLRASDDYGDIQPYSSRQHHPQPPTAYDAAVAVAAAATTDAGGGGGTFSVSASFTQLYGGAATGPSSSPPNHREFSFLRIVRQRQLLEGEQQAAQSRTLRGWRSWTGGLVRRMQRSFNVVSGGPKSSFSAIRAAAVAGLTGGACTDDSDGTAAAAAATDHQALEQGSEREGACAAAAAAAGTAAWDVESRSSSQSHGTPSSNVSHATTSLHSLLMHPGRRRRRAGGPGGRNRVLYSSPATYGSELQANWSELPKEFVVDPASVGAVLVFRGFRVRCGMHSGVRTSAEVNRNHPSGRTRYSGPALLCAKAVSDAAHGGMVFASRHTVELCSSTFLASGRVVLWRLGDHVLGCPRLPASLFQLFNTALVLRAALNRPLTRTFMPLSLGLLDAPLSAVACAAIKLSAMSLFNQVHPGISIEAASVFQALAYQYARLYGGYLAQLGVGRALCVFPDAYRAALWAATMHSRMFGHPWSDALLATQQCQPRSIRDAQGNEQVIGRGPRVKAVVHFGPVSTMLHPVTGQLSYEGGAVDLAQRLLGGLGPNCVVATLEAAASLRRYLPPDLGGKTVMVPSQSTNSHRASKTQPGFLPMRGFDAEALAGGSGSGVATGGAGGADGTGSVSQRSSLTVLRDAVQQPQQPQQQHQQQLTYDPLSHVPSRSSMEQAAALQAGGTGTGPTSGGNNSSSGYASPISRVFSQAPPRLGASPTVTGPFATGAIVGAGPHASRNTHYGRVIARRASGPISGSATPPSPYTGPAAAAAAAAAGVTSAGWRRDDFRSKSMGRVGPLPRAASPIIPNTDSANTSETEGTDGGGGGTSGGDGATVIGGAAVPSVFRSRASSLQRSGAPGAGVHPSLDLRGGRMRPTAAPATAAAVAGGAAAAGAVPAGAVPAGAAAAGAVPAAAAAAAMAAAASATNDSTLLLLLTMSGEVPTAVNTAAGLQQTANSSVAHAAALAGAVSLTSAANPATAGVGASSLTSGGGGGGSCNGRGRMISNSGASALLGWMNNSTMPSQRQLAPSESNLGDTQMISNVSDPRVICGTDGSSGSSHAPLLELTSPLQRSVAAANANPMTAPPSTTATDSPQAQNPEAAPTGQLGQTPSCKPAGSLRGSGPLTEDSADGDLHGGEMKHMPAPAAAAVAAAAAAPLLASRQQAPPSTSRDSGTAKDPAADAPMQATTGKARAASAVAPVSLQSHAAATVNPTAAAAAASDTTGSAAARTAALAQTAPPPAALGSTQGPASTSQDSSVPSAGGVMSPVSAVTGSTPGSSSPASNVLIVNATHVAAAAVATTARLTAAAAAAATAAPSRRRPPPRTGSTEDSVGHGTLSPSQLSESAEISSDPDAAGLPAPAAVAEIPSPAAAIGTAGKTPQRQLRQQQSARDPGVAAAAAVQVTGMYGSPMGPRRVHQSFTFGQRGSIMARPRLQDLLAVSLYPVTDAGNEGGTALGAAGTAGIQPSGRGGDAGADGGGAAGGNRFPGRNTRGGQTGGYGKYSNTAAGRGSGVAGAASVAAGGGDSDPGGLPSDPAGRAWAAELQSSSSASSRTGNGMWGAPGGLVGSGSLESIIRGPQTRISRSFTFATHRRSPLAVSSYAGDPELGTSNVGASGTATAGASSLRPLSGLSRVLYGAAAAVGVVPREGSGSTAAEANRDAGQRRGGSASGGVALPPPAPALVPQGPGVGGIGGGAGHGGIRRDGSSGRSPGASTLGAMNARVRRGSQPQQQYTNPFEIAAASGRAAAAAAAAGGLMAGPAFGVGITGSGSLPTCEYAHSSNSAGTLRGSVASAQLRTSVGDNRGILMEGGRGSGASLGSNAVLPSAYSEAVAGAGGSGGCGGGLSSVGMRPAGSQQHSGSATSGLGGIGSQVSGLLARVRSGMTRNASRSHSLSRNLPSSGIQQDVLTAQQHASSPRGGGGIASGGGAISPAASAVNTEAAQGQGSGDLPMASGASVRLPTSSLLQSSGSGGGAAGPRALRSALPGEKLPTLPEASLAPLLREIRHLQLRLVPLRLTATGGCIKGAPTVAAVEAAERAAAAAAAAASTPGAAGAADGEVRAVEAEAAGQQGVVERQVSGHQRQQGQQHHEAETQVQKATGGTGRNADYIQVYRVTLLDSLPPARCQASAQAQVQGQGRYPAHQTPTLTPNVTNAQTVTPLPTQSQVYLVPRTASDDPRVAAPSTEADPRISVAVTATVRCGTNSQVPSAATDATEVATLAAPPGTRPPDSAAGGGDSNSGTGVGENEGQRAAAVASGTASDGYSISVDAKAGLRPGAQSQRGDSGPAVSLAPTFTASGSGDAIQAASVSIVVAAATPAISPAAIAAAGLSAASGSTGASAPAGAGAGSGATVVSAVDAAIAAASSSAGGGGGSAGAGAGGCGDDSLPLALPQQQQQQQPQGGLGDAEDDEDEEGEDAEAHRLVIQYVYGFTDLADPAYADLWAAHPERSLLKDRCIKDVVQLRARLAVQEAYDEVFERDNFLF